MTVPGTAAAPAASWFARTAPRLALLVAFAVNSTAADGRVEFSDGHELSGAIRFADALTIHDGAEARVIPADQVREVRLEPESEEMVHQWRFPEPGKTRKEESGEPYPLRHLRAVVATAAGEVRGHLMTTVVYVVADGDDAHAERVLLLSKQQGKRGETLASLAYPTRIVVGGAAATAAAPLIVVGAAAGAPATVLGLGSLARFEAVADGARWHLPAPVRAPAFVAVREGDALRVAWPAAEVDAEVRADAEKAVELARDFMDERKLLALWAPTGEDLYGLMMLKRAGSSTFEENVRPWRLEVWRWKRDVEDGRLLWAGRGYFFRDNVRPDVAPPAVRLEPTWWEQADVEGGLSVGGARDAKDTQEKAP